MKKENVKRICSNCGQFFPASIKEPTKYGICLNNDNFEPYIEELIENSNYDCCQEQIDNNKFLGQQKGCKYFEEYNTEEAEEESFLDTELRRLTEKGEFNPDTAKNALLKNTLRNIDWQNIPIENYVKKLESGNEKIQKAGIISLGSLISHENKEAFNVLLNFFKKLPSPKTQEDIYLKKEILKQLEVSNEKKQIIPYLVNDLYEIHSNNMMQQWISYIFRFLEKCQKDEISEYLEKMLNDKKFPYTFKKKIKIILCGDDFDFGAI